MADGRADNFATGSVEAANQAPAPSFSTRQQNIERNYTPRSVLDNFMPSGNGYGAPDSSRLLPGGQILPGQNGKSDSTQQQGVWLTSPYRTIG